MRRYFVINYYTILIFGQIIPLSVTIKQKQSYLCYTNEISLFVYLWSRVLAVHCRPPLLQSTPPFEAPLPPPTSSSPPLPREGPSLLTPPLWSEKRRCKMKGGATSISWTPRQKRFCPFLHLNPPPDPVSIQRHLLQPIIVRRIISSHVREANPSYTMENTHRAKVWTPQKHLILACLLEDCWP